MAGGLVVLDKSRLKLVPQSMKTVIDKVKGRVGGMRLTKNVLATLLCEICVRVQGVNNVLEIT